MHNPFDTWSDSLGLEAFADERWNAGREERGLDPQAPFKGDPIGEFKEEIGDALNYLAVMQARGIVSEMVAHEARGLLHSLWTMVRTAER